MQNGLKQMTTHRNVKLSETKAFIFSVFYPKMAEYSFAPTFRSCFYLRQILLSDVLFKYYRTDA